MAWASASDIPGRYGSDFYIWIADRDKDGAVSGDDLTAVNDSLDSATSKAAAYIGAKYDLEGPDTAPPTGIAGLDAIPEAVKDAVVDLAVYDLAGYDSGALTKEHRQRYEDSIQFLRDIGSGRAALAVANPPATVGASVMAKSRARVRSTESTEGLV